ncbi:hypothetical protein L596_015032 [Steinernema carpocapsae]|uniref:Uncharacterized protein n=1 Tax=Steinernema carpocapsae TaxID=34508 RepID=A0A4U5NEL8_STECR|nr:hypothetical protein L596_015032 [Steinernema carpocapsae]
MAFLVASCSSHRETAEEKTFVPVNVLTVLKAGSPQKQDVLLAAFLIHNITILWMRNGDKNKDLYEQLSSIKFDVSAVNSMPSSNAAQGKKTET